MELSFGADMKDCSFFFKCFSLTKGYPQPCVYGSVWFQVGTEGKRRNSMELFFGANMKIFFFFLQCFSLAV